METKPSVWKGVEKREKFSILTLASCIVVLTVIVLLRLF
jgi:hypothetical protein